MIQKPFLKVLALTAFVTLSACGQSGRQLGAAVDEGAYGNPTMNNMMLHTGEIQIRIDLAERFAREVDSTITFAFNSSRLTSNARATLDEQANWIKQFPEVRFRVYGHTDLVGSTDYNQRLGKRRADSVVNYLVSRGIERRRLEAVVSFGETQPLVLTEGREMRNRRTVTEVSGFLADNPLILNGDYAAVIARTYVSAGTNN